MSQKRAFRLYRYFAGIAGVRTTLLDALEPERAMSRLFLPNTASLPVVPSVEIDNDGNYTLLFRDSLKNR